MRQPIFFFLLCLFLSACTQWETKKIASEEYFAQQWETIDINEVEVYPSFDNCNELAEKSQLLSCFEQKITQSFYGQLEKETFVVSRPIEDTVWLDLVIDEKGTLCIDSLHIKASIREEIPLLQKYIYEAAQIIPQAYPARNREIPVKTSFKLPIILKVEKEF